MVNFLYVMVKRNERDESPPSNILFEHLKKQFYYYNDFLHKMVKMDKVVKVPYPINFSNI